MNEDMKALHEKLDKLQADIDYIRENMSEKYVSLKDIGGPIIGASENVIAISSNDKLKDRNDN